MGESTWFGNILQGRGESSALLVALAVGAFGLLTLLETVNVGSIPWWILSFSYSSGRPILHPQ